MRSWIKNLGLAIVGIILISWAITLFISLTIRNLSDLWRAISDLQLQISVIGVTLCILSLCAFYSASRSKSLENSPQKKEHIKPIVGLRLRTRHGSWKSVQTEKANTTWSANFWQGMSTEFWGAVITTLLLGLGVLIFDQYQDIQNRKDELIWQMNSPNHELALQAVRIIEHEGWLTDGTLYQIDLLGANLQEADLMGANLQEASLRMANLQEADLLYANLQEANLWEANLQEANLWEANLQEANLREASLQEANLQRTNLQGAELTSTNLQEADLQEANLQGANLWNANLQGANLELAIFDRETILPDAQRTLTCSPTEADIREAELLTGGQFDIVAALEDLCLNSNNVETLDALWKVNGIRVHLEIYSYDKYWTPETDMNRYTDPNHPVFWQPNWIIEQQANP